VDEIIFLFQPLFYFCLVSVLFQLCGHHTIIITTMKLAIAWHR